MEQVLTLVCKLNPTPKQVEEIELVLKAFADACNYTNKQVKPQVTSKTTDRPRNAIARQDVA